VKNAALRLGVSSKFIRLRVQTGDLEGFKHSRLLITVSLESLVAYEERTRVCASSAVHVEKAAA